jgi:hypothetical protein
MGVDKIGRTELQRVFFVRNLKCLYSGGRNTKFLKHFWLCIWNSFGRNPIFPSLHHFSIVAPFPVRELYYCTKKKRSDSAAADDDDNDDDDDKANDVEIVIYRIRQKNIYTL